MQSSIIKKDFQKAEGPETIRMKIIFPETASEWNSISDKNQEHS